MILIVDKTSKKQKVIQESLQKVFPEYKNFVVDNGAHPFEVLKHQQNIEMVIICEPTTAYYNEDNSFGANEFDHAVVWIEVLRNGGVWNDSDVQFERLIIKPKTKDQLPILYIHPSYPNSNHYPNSYPRHFLIDDSGETTLPKAMKFTKKWYKSIGANEVVFYPWEPEELKQAFLNCINNRLWNRELLPDKTVKKGSRRHGH
jgi:hypothetical protein